MRVGVCCGSCHVELKNDDIVVLDDLGILRHQQCYDFTNCRDFIDTVGEFEFVRGKLPAFLIDAYREVIAWDERKMPKDISDEEVYAVLANTLGYQE
jgi:hypothetical protein